MLNPSTMRRYPFPTGLGAFALLAGALPGLAHAQTTMGGPTLGPSAFKYPERFSSDGRIDLGTGPRAQNLTPLGISYKDCIDDQQLRFSVAVSGFKGQDIQIWASKNGDCTSDVNRGVGGVPSCWQLNGGLSAINQSTTSTYQFLVRVQDIVGPQNNPPNPPGYRSQTPAACTTQPTYASETFTVYFVPITNGNNATGTAYSYKLPVDLVGPPAPSGLSHNVGDTLFVMNWTPNSDTDTGGYDLYIDPIPGMESSDASTSDSGLGKPMLECPDTGAPAQPQDASGDDGGEGGSDAASDASTFVPAEAGCHYVYVGGGSATLSTCTDSRLASGMVQEGGTTTVVTSDEAGDEGGTTVVTGGGGISTIPSTNLVGTGGGGLTVSDKSTGSYTIKGLKNNVTYTVVVAAVDLFGNVGPPSAEQCDYPAPVNDFWQDYRNDGGRAGGFCALEAVGASPATSLVGVAFAAGTAGAVRRLRRRRTR
jgi:hypothetical protein